MKIQVPKPISRFFFRIRALFPSQLPVGVSEFNSYCDKIIDAYGFPNNSSYRFTIGTMIMNKLSPTTDKKSIYYFVKSIRKAMANEIAYFVIMQIKDEREKEEKAKLAATDNKGESHEAISK